jgi:hypothetical protein
MPQGFHSDAAGVSKQCRRVFTAVPKVFTAASQGFHSDMPQGFHSSAAGFSQRRRSDMPHGFTAM